MFPVVLFPPSDANFLCLSIGCQRAVDGLVTTAGTCTNRVHGLGLVRHAGGLTQGWVELWYGVWDPRDR